MYLITGGVGFLACVIFIIIIIVSALKGKPAVIPLVAFVLSMVLFMGSGFLYTRTDPQVGGTIFLEYITRNKTVPPNLEGEWKEVVDEKADSYHGIYISGRTIEVYWVSDGGKSRTLYWAGTYDAPADGQEPYTWVSQNDTRRTAAALLASGEDVKEFTYKNGKISYNASVLGVTTEMRAEKAEWGYFSPAGGEDSPDNAADSNAPAEESIASGDVGNFHVEVKNAVLASDFEGNPALVVTCSWTNNSPDTLSAMAALSGRAFQDGTELETAMVVASDAYSTESNIRDMLPGTSVDIQYAYLLSSETAAVEFRLAELNGPEEAAVPATFDLAALAPAE